MAHQTHNALLSCFGFVIWGDWGPLTLYRDHQGKIVAYAKTWPQKAPSADQVTRRNLFRAAALAWNALPAAKRSDWTLAAHRVSLCATGYNLWVWWQLTPDPAALATIARQTAVTLP